MEMCVYNWLVTDKKWLLLQYILNDIVIFTLDEQQYSKFELLCSFEF